MPPSAPGPVKSLPCPEERLFVELARTVHLLSRGPTQLLRDNDLSPNQYNILRILRGAPDGLLCGEIATRMISRDPDITRLLDRLEKRGLIRRCRGNPARRKVRVRIAADGLCLLKGLDQPVCDLHRRQIGHLGQTKLASLSALLRACTENAA